MACSRPAGGIQLPMRSIIDCLEYWAAVQPDARFCSFLDIEGSEKQTYTYRGFHQRTSYLAEFLLREKHLRRGDRALLVYPPGLELIVTFFACARLGVIPVPVPPATHSNFERGLAKFTFVVRDCQATVALTTAPDYQAYRLRLEQHRTSSSSYDILALSKLDWITTDNVTGEASNGFCNDPHSILFLQYTSGSTSDPKGVIVSHENVIHNARSTIDHTPIGVSWLPQYHDMGLIGYYLFPMVMGGTTYGLTPLDFLKRPLIWLRTISRVRATYSSSPNFGFAYCLREDKVSTAQLDDLDLSSLRVLMNASEPVRAETYLRFLEKFAPYGLQSQAHIVAYGLAENTLAVTHRGRRIVAVNRRLLQKGTLRFERAKPLTNTQLHLVSCGKPLDGIHVRVVNSESQTTLGERQLGEIWVAGESTCQGYWKRPALTQEAFGNALVNDSEDRNAYVRTGDLGFLHEGQLFVCGRIKDLIIIHGVNYYPQDIEAVVEAVSQKIRVGSVAAINGFEEGEGLVVVVEVKNTKDLPDHAQITQAIRRHCGIEPQAIVVVRPRTIAKTTSGKIARSLTRQRWLDGELAAIAVHLKAKEKELTGGCSELRGRFQSLIKSHNLTGREEETFAEIGLDSLTVVTLLLEIEHLLEEHGATDLVGQVDGRFLQCLPLAEFASLVDQFDTASEEAVTSLRNILHRVTQEQDRYERACMRSHAERTPTGRVEIPTSAAPLTTALLTGPTGFFGPFLLHNLLHHTPYTYYALTRAKDPVAGVDRIRMALRRAQVWTPNLDEELRQRVHVVCGDISHPNLGLQADQWRFLATRVQAVVHNAAVVDYMLNYETLKPTNVDGTRELLRFSFTDIPKEFHHISSTTIFGWTVKDLLLETDCNCEMEALDFGYAQSKWVAEQLVFAAEQQGLTVRVYRPAFITASIHGAGSKKDIVARLLAFMINHGIAVNARNQISLLPADIAAANIAAIFADRRIFDRTLHVTVDGYYSLTDVTREITRNYGYPFVYYDIPSFVAEAKRRCAQTEPLYPLLDFFTRSHLKMAAIQHKRYSNDRYREARQLAGNDNGDPTLTETVSYLMASMVREGLISEAARVRRTLPHQVARGKHVPQAL
jgi:thioester reductase-like protein